MSFIITRLRLEGYRNYAEKEFLLGPGTTLLVGRNAAGKTNALEALYVMATGDTFRAGRLEDLVGWGGLKARVRLEAETDSGRHLEAVLEVEADSRRMLVNGKKKRASAALFKDIPAVLFVPDDLRLIKDSAERRRGGVDSLGRRLSRGYATLLAEYERALRQRNTLLKEGAVRSRIQPWTEVLIEKGASLWSARKRLTDRLAANAQESYSALAEGERLSIDYLTSWYGDDATGESAEEALERALFASAAEEERRAVTVVGPHRDDISFLIGQKDARLYGSQGQQRSVVLAWKLAEVRVVEEITGNTPILLLDDVMSELDGTRRRSLSELLVGGFQSVVTTTNLDYFERDFIEQSTVVELG